MRLWRFEIQGYEGREDFLERFTRAPVASTILHSSPPPEAAANDGGLVEQESSRGNGAGLALVAAALMPMPLSLAVPFPLSTSCPRGAPVALPFDELLP